MEKKRNIKMLLLAIVLCFSCILTCFMPTINSVCFASNIGVVGGYTNVVEDLQQDDTFNAENYVVNETDYSLQVITIAESSDKELFVYVYQPTAHYGNLRATSISMSTTRQTANTFGIYYLTYVNSQGCFYKYVVKNFVVSDNSIRTYEIETIYRSWNENFDAESGTDNTINELGFPVGKQFTFAENNGQTTFAVEDVDYITITDKYVGFVRYFGGNSYLFCLDSCDSHFVAFSTDRQIDKLLEADVYFQTQKVYYENGLSGVDDWDFYDVKDNYSYITEYDTAFYESPSSAWQGYSYSWSRIQTIDEFFASNEFDTIHKGTLFNQKLEYKMDEESKAYMENMQWVLRFYESSYEKTNAPYPTKSYTIVSNVSILRLKFETEGVVYDLGVVDNKQSGDFNPDNNMKSTLELSDIFKIILIVLLLIVLLIVLNPILPYVFKFIGFILKAIWWVITAPFKLIGKVFKKQDKTKK